MIVFLLLHFSSCKTYLISLESFKQQFHGIDSSSLKMVEMLGGGGIMVRQKYLANPITHIRCTDKKGNLYMLENAPNIEIRFTYLYKNRKKKTVFYFDRVYVTDKTVIGYRSRILGLPKTIPLDSIIKIEVQNGRKNYYYVKN